MFLSLLLGAFKGGEPENETKGEILWIDKMFPIAHRMKEKFICTEVI